MFGVRRKHYLSVYTFIIKNVVLSFLFTFLIRLTRIKPNQMLINRLKSLHELSEMYHNKQLLVSMSKID